MKVKQFFSVGLVYRLLVTLVLSTVFTLLFKALIDIPRPCQIDPLLVLQCPSSYAFPSFHTSTAFSFVFPFLGHFLFPLTFLGALITAGSRIVFDVHTWYDIGGGIAIAGLSFNIAENLFNRHKKTVLHVCEWGRQAIHLGVGVLLVISIFFLGIEPVFMGVLIGTWAGMFLIHLKMIGSGIPVIDGLLNRFERGGVIPGEGSMYFALGILFAMGLLRNQIAAVVCVLLVLSMSDALSTIVGTSIGEHRLPWNSKKTVEGSLAFLGSALCTYIILSSPVTIFIAILGTALESLPMKIDDNLVIPVILSLVFFFFL